MPAAQMPVSTSAPTPAPIAAPSQPDLPPVLADQTVMSLLKTYQLLPHLWRELAIDRAIAPFGCTDAEADVVRQSFFAQQGMPEQQWLEAQGVDLEEVMAPLRRGVRIEKFKQATWGHTLESYFLQRQPQLDQVIYSMIQHSDSDLITELYFRLQEGEATFAELAAAYSQGLAGQTRGMMGPVELGDLHPRLATLFRQSQSRQVVKTWVGDWYILAQIEVKIPAQLDAQMRQRLLDERYANWLQQAINQPAAVV
ncbi:MAG: peptidylprolyl isomerase [Elainella sp.]